MTDIKHRNPIVTETIRTLIEHMGEPELTDADTANTEGLHLVFDLSWQEREGKFDPSNTLIVPAAGEDGEPRLLLITNPGPGGIRTQVERFPHADEDLTVALFNLIIGFSD